MCVLLERVQTKLGGGKGIIVPFLRIREIGRKKPFSVELEVFHWGSPVLGEALFASPMEVHLHLAKLQGAEVCCSSPASLAVKAWGLSTGRGPCGLTCCL